MANENAATTDGTVESVRTYKSNPPPLGYAEGILGQEQELELATSRADGERELVEAVLRSRTAMLELAALGRALGEDPDTLEDLVRARVGEEATDESLAKELLGLLSRVRRLAQAPGISLEEQEERADLTSKLAAYRWNPKAVSRLVDRVQRADHMAEPCVEPDGSVCALASAGAAHGPLPDTHEDRTRAIALIRRAQTKVEHARGRLVSANLRLVAWMARRQAHRGLPLKDLIQEGNIGLMRAADKFDHRRGIRFTTYASFWVRHAVNRALSDQSRTIRLPVHLIETKHKMETARQGLAQELGREPTSEELARKTGLALAKIQQALDCPKQPLSMDVPAFSESEAKLGDLIFDPRAESAIDRISERHVRETVRKMLGTLAPREQLVLKMRFGIDHPDGITLQEIGDALALSRERIRQIEEQALSKLRQRAEPDDELAAFLAG